MKKYLTTYYLLLTTIIIIASFFRLYNIIETPPGFYPDEAIYANNGVEAWETGDFKIFYPENNGREGLWPNIIGFFITKFGNEPWVLRSIAAIFGILTVLGTYFLSKELFAKNIALLSSFLIATSFWHILFSRIGFRAIMAPAFLVWGIFLLLKTLNQIKNNFQFSIFNFQSNLKNIILIILGGIFYGLGFHSYIAYRATPLLALIVIILYWLQNRDWQIRKKIILSTIYFLLATIIAAAPLGLYFLKNPQDFFGRTTQISIFNSESPIKNLSENILKTAGMFNFSGDYNWRHNYAGKPLLFWPVGIMFLIGILIGLQMFFKKMSRRLSGHGFERSEKSEAESQAASERLGERDRGFREKYLQAYIVLFSWLIIAALPVIISNEGMPHALRAILMAPTIFIFAGFGGIYIYEKIKNLAILKDSKIKTNSLRLIVAIFIIILIIQSYQSYFIDWGKNPEVAGAFNQNYVDIGRQLNALPKELPKYVIVKSGGVNVRGVPMPAQTIMFITDTFTPKKQKEKNIFYILPNQTNQIPTGSFIFEIN